MFFSWDQIYTSLVFMSCYELFFISVLNCMSSYCSSSATPTPKPRRIATASSAFATTPPKQRCIATATASAASATTPISTPAASTNYTPDPLLPSTTSNQQQLPQPAIVFQCRPNPTQSASPSPPQLPILFTTRSPVTIIVVDPPGPPPSPPQSPISPTTYRPCCPQLSVTTATTSISVTELHQHSSSSPILFLSVPTTPNNQ